MNEGPMVDEFGPAIERSRLDVDVVRAGCEKALHRPLFWFPVRHHSPACARHLELVLKKRKPRLVFVEGPSEASDLIPHIVDPKTRPPVAIYSAFRKEPSPGANSGELEPGSPDASRSACFFPLLPYSPEYVAMEAARRLDAEIRFIDLPHFASTRDQPAIASVRTVERESDRLITESSFFQELTRASGYRSWDEAWDSLFELREFSGPEEFRRELAFFCAAARATASAHSLEQDGTLERERYMTRAIRSALEEARVAPGDAIVICGGFHLFLDETDQTPPPDIPSGSLYTTLVPFSYARVSALSGYAAGNRAPRFYERLWEAARGRGMSDVATTHAIEVVREARRRGEPLSSADAIATAQTAGLLAGLRRRAGVGLDDLDDALVTCCCKGDPSRTGHRLLQAMATVACGSRLGKVTRAVRQLPLVEDFHVQLKELDLEKLIERDTTVDLTLDLRTTSDGRRSAFLHRLALLDVPVGHRIDGPAISSRLFQESWSCRWSPGITAGLIEKSPYGDTVERAALALLNEKIRLATSQSDVVCGWLVEAQNLDLPAPIESLAVACRNAIDADDRFHPLTRALLRLLDLRQRLAILGRADPFALDLMLRCFDRACLAISGVVAAPSEEHEEVLEGLLVLAGTSTREDHPGLDRKLFTDQIRRAIDTTKIHFLRGVFLGVLTELRRATVAELASELEKYALSPPDLMVRVGEFLDGVMAASRASILLEADVLVGAIDRLLHAADPDAFLTMLPRLRAAFERLAEGSRREFASCVATRYGLASPRILKRPLRTTNVLAAVLDERTAAIMKEWED